MEETKKSFGLKIPFNNYDVFGYLIPGSTLLSLCFLFEFWLNKKVLSTTIDYTGKDLLPFFIMKSSHSPFYHIGELFISVERDDSFVSSLLLIFAILLFSYVIGHIVSSISAFSIDRTLIGKGYAYPLKTLTEEVDKFTTRQNFVRALFIGFNLLICFAVFLVFIDTNRKLVFNTTIILMFVSSFLVRYTNILYRVIETSFTLFNLQFEPKLKLLCLGKTQRLWNKKLNLSVNGELENIPLQNSVEVLRYQDQLLTKSLLDLKMKVMKA